MKLKVKWAWRISLPLAPGMKENFSVLVRMWDSLSCGNEGWDYKLGINSSSAVCSQPVTGYFSMGWFLVMHAFLVADLTKHPEWNCFAPATPHPIAEAFWKYWVAGILLECYSSMSFLKKASKKPAGGEGDVGSEELGGDMALNVCREVQKSSPSHPLWKNRFNSVSKNIRASPRKPIMWMSI